MGSAKKHHYVPQFYLRLFANEQGRLKVVERAPPHRSYVSHIRDVAEEHLFYRIETGSGPSDDVEKELSRIESDAKSAFERIVKGPFPPSDDDRQFVSFFLALQWLRGRDQRDDHNRFYDHVTKFFMASMPRTQLRKSLREVLGKEPSDAKVDKMKAIFADETGYTVMPHQNFSIGAILRMSEGLGRVANSFTWKLVRFEEPCLLTTDAPVAMWTRPEKRNGLIPIAGWMSDEVLFALDMRHALVLVNDGLSAATAQAGTAEHARAFNYLVAARSYRRIFHHPDINPLEGFRLPP